MAISLAVLGQLVVRWLLGAESNEAALKIARKRAHGQGKNRPKVIVAEGAFHGRTLLTLSATANASVKQGFYPLDEDFIRVPFSNADAIEAACASDPDICAVFLEPIQGEGGIRLPDRDYLNQVQAICHEYDILFMLDEIQTGNGRTGQPYAYMHHGLKPDVVTTAKGLANGFPVGACMVDGRALSVFGTGSHGSTYGGTPLQCRAVHATIDVLIDDQIAKNAALRGQQLSDRFKSELDGRVEVRGMGLMIGIELPHTCSELVNIARDEHQLLINVTAGSVVRLLPPLIMDEEQTEQLADKVISLINEFLSAR